jgi:hypothetical protein
LFFGGPGRDHDIKVEKRLGPNKHINRSNRCPQHTNEQNSMMKYVGPKGRRRRRRRKKERKKETFGSLCS